MTSRAQWIMTFSLMLKRAIIQCTTNFISKTKAKQRVTTIALSGIQVFVMHICALN